MPLPAPDHRILSAAPLLVTVAQVRFDAQAALAAPEAAKALIDGLAPVGLTAMTQVHQQQVVVLPAASAEQLGQQPLQQPVGWQFASKDGATTLSVLTDQVTLETRNYDGWGVFAEIWRNCLATVFEVSRPRIVTRIGLRYVNRITPANVMEPEQLRAADLVDPSFLGPAIGSPLSEFVTASEGRVTLDFGDGVDGLVHHGVSTQPGPMSFVLDIDCFRAAAAAYDSEAFAASWDSLNEHALQVFQTVVRPELRAEMENPGVVS
jgi:uncharacterized protein (TIGR04255 family)